MSSQTTDKLAEEIQAIIWQVEKCGASPDLTKAVIMLGELRDSVMKSVPVEKWPRKETMLAAAKEAALSQRIQMAVWEYMDKEKGKRNGVELAAKIIEDVKETCFSKDLQERGHLK